MPEMSFLLRLENGEEVRTTEKSDREIAIFLRLDFASVLCFHLPALRASNSENLPPESSIHPRSSGPLRRGAILIANLELEFHVSPIRITRLRFSNRKYSPLFHPPWRNAISRSAFSSLVAGRPLRLGRPDAGGPVVSRFLIVTPRLEFRAIKTKQTPSSISNGEKPTEKAPAGGQRYELQRQKSRQDAGATRETAVQKQGRKKRRNG